MLERWGLAAPTVVRGWQAGDDEALAAGAPDSSELVSVAPAARTGVLAVQISLHLVLWVACVAAGMGLGRLLLPTAGG